VALQATSNLTIALSFVPTFHAVGLAFRVVVHSPHDNGVEGSVELAVPSAIEPVALGAKDLSRADRTNARLGDERRSEPIDQLGYLCLA
jgi:hypothetical protein